MRYLDVISLSQFEIHNAVASLGTSLTENHLHKIFRYTPEIIFFGDRTEPPGNDYGIVRALDEAPEPSRWHAVTKWQDTMSILRDSYGD